MIYLLLEYWRCDYGRRLLNFAVEELQSYGFEQIVLWVLQSNIRARCFYEINGFLPDGLSKAVQLGGRREELRYCRCCKDLK